MPLSFTRVILYSKSPALLKAFYQQHFAFQLVEEISNEWVVLKAGEFEIAFHRVGETYRNDATFKAQSNAKLVFETSFDLEELSKKLVAAGVTMREVKSYQGFNYLLCDGEDPEGNVFQLMKRKSS